MSLDLLPEIVRHSYLAQLLDDKVREPQPVLFNYWGKFKDLRENIASQVGEMKVLFPEYTPHDEPQHLARLFSIADKLLGVDRYKQMNVAELFILACGLYAHDWGMAVGPEEQAYLRAGAMGNIDSEIFTPLEDEAERLREFVKKQGLTISGNSTFPHLNDDLLRLYIRQTHAWRSGARTRAFFQSAGSGVSLAVDRVCQGHWLGFAQLDNEERFPSHLGVLGHSVNLRAISIYVRLVDLFDIADDRTPYAVWRFVSPSDSTSSMEWKKHRALNPVTFPSHGDGRCVRFDGSTSDPEVWAELEDLRRYCEEQIEGSMDLLARHSDPRHSLDLRKLEWRVSAERFKPIDIRFEFNRQRMFDILADEIYQGDSYVFLRELLQNSIDAVRLRKALLEQRTAKIGGRRNIGLGFDDAIYFEVNHMTDGDAVIICRDNGIGMDEYIVRNYLAIAGVSYYQSEEFRRQGLNMDPISRFGVGVLSCFMVAERIEIVTYRDPHASGAAEPLRINIPAVDKQFRIHADTTDSAIGTVMTVHVLGKKLKSDVKPSEDIGETDIPFKLQVSDYLCAIAGFVDFPIVVDEDDQRTVILHPNCSPSLAEQFVHPNMPLKIYQTTSKYPWDHVFAPQDVHSAEKHLKEFPFNLQSDLGLDGFEGNITYLLPRDEESTVEYQYNHDQYERIVLNAKNEDTLLRFRSTEQFSEYQKNGIARSSRTRPTLSIYRDGLLVADTLLPEQNKLSYSYQSLKWPSPSIKINLPKSVCAKIDVSRRMLVTSDPRWDVLIWKNVVKNLAEKFCSSIFSQLPQMRLVDLSKLALFFHLSDAEVAELVPLKKWPLTILRPGELCTVIDDYLECEGSIISAPSSMFRAMLRIMDETTWSINHYNADNLKLWRGPVCVFIEHTGIFYKPNLYQNWFAQNYRHISSITNPVVLRFLTPIYPGLPPISVKELKIVEVTPIRKMDLLHKVMSNPLDIIRFRRWNFVFSYGYVNHLIMDAIPFDAPFENLFSVPPNNYNLHHPTAIFLIKCVASIAWHKHKRTRSTTAIGKAEDLLNMVNSYLDDQELINDHINNLASYLINENFIDAAVSIPLLTVEDYYKQSPISKLLEIALDTEEQPDDFNFSDNFRGEILKAIDAYARPFGLPLKNTVHEDVPLDIANLIENYISFVAGIQQEPEKV